MQPCVVVSALLLALPGGALVAQAASPPSTRTELPVKSVVLFSSGVGYFEHAGSVRGDGTTELRFKTAQINDVLKSLILQDQDGGRVTNVTYASQDPVSKTLRSFQVDITSNPGMASLLNQLRGAPITVQASAEKVSGTILGVETRRKAADKGEYVDLSVLNILSGAMIRSIDLPSISSLTLDDAALQDELTKALATLVTARDQDKKPVTISFSGSGERRVRMGYVVETPIWKTSYRLMLDDKNGRLQGWAIVENQTESDWNDVSLSLVSGRPISFIMDLYQPLYSQRPTVVPELFAGLRPQRYDPGTDPARQSVQMVEAITVKEEARNALVPRDAVATKQTVTGEMTRALPVDRYVAGLAAQPGIVQGGQPYFSVRGGPEPVVSAATTRQLGALFQYAIPDVTLARQKSAMLPIVADSVGIERLSIYNASVLSSNPLNGVRLKNTTGKHLLQGPVTVLEKNSYAGDSRIDDVPPGQERLLSFGIDLDLLVDNTKSTQNMAVTTAKITKGALIVARKFVNTRTYQVDNKGSHDKTILIEHPIRRGWTLIDTPKPVETTPSLYRFQGNAVAGKVTVLTIKEEYIQEETIEMLPADIEELVTYNRTGEIPPGVRAAVMKAIEMKQAILDVDAQVKDRTAQITAITTEQGRIRENMKTVDTKTQYYERLLSKLNEQETSIERLQKDRDALLVRRDVQQKALDDYLGALTVG